MRTGEIIATQGSSSGSLTWFPQFTFVQAYFGQEGVAPVAAAIGSSNQE